MTIYSKGEFSALAKTAAEKFPDAKVMNADASDEVFLKEEGITSYDLAICCTHNHEMNMILAAYLESLGVKQTVSLVASSAFARIKSISPRKSYAFFAAIVVCHVPIGFAHTSCAPSEI